MKKLPGGSDRYGLCEFCNTEVDSMYISMMVNTNYRFGHKDCIERYETTARDNDYYESHFLRDGREILREKRGIG